MGFRFVLEVVTLNDLEWIYGRCENELRTSRLWKVIVRQTYTYYIQTDRQMPSKLYTMLLCGWFKMQSTTAQPGLCGGNHLKLLDPLGLSSQLLGSELTTKPTTTKLNICRSYVQLNA